MKTSKLILFTTLLAVLGLTSVSCSDDNSDERNMKKGEEFLAENAKKEGVTVTGSGLQYKIIVQGDGEKPTSKDEVKCYYTGTLINGKKFDGTTEGTPAVFKVNRVITGWQEALQLMPVGSKWEIYLPYYLAYGAYAVGNDIKPYSALIFEIELLEIVE